MTASVQPILALVHAAMPAMLAYRMAARERLLVCLSRERSFGRVGAALGSHASERYQAATLLIQSEKLWDAEILLRSAAEAVFKLLFIALADFDERQRRIMEYDLTLSRMADLRQSERARSKLAILPSDSPDRSVFQAIVLPAEEEEQIRAELPRRERQRLAAKWSFSEVVEWLDAALAACGGSRVTRTILHTYGISSHLIHADERGLALVHDRLARPDAERSSLEIAHAARLLSDLIAFYKLTVIALEAVARLGLTPAFQEADAASAAFEGRASVARDAFYESQAELYRLMGMPYPT